VETLLVVFTDLRVAYTDRLGERGDIQHQPIAADGTVERLVQRPSAGEAQMFGDSE
jgi:hypothetical protein